MNFHQITKSATSSLTTTLYSMLMLCLCPSLLNAETEPFGLYVWHEDGRAYMHMNCLKKFTDQGEVVKDVIVCESTTTYISYVSEPGEFEQQWIESEYQQYFDSNGNLKLNNEESAQLSQMCKTDALEYARFFLGKPFKNTDFTITEEQLAEFNNRAKGRTERQNSYLVAEMETLLTFCDQQTLDNFKAVGKAAYSREAATCRFTHQSISEEYKRIRAHLWVNESKSDFSPCKRVNISTIRLPEGGNSFIDWEFELRSFSLDKSAKSFSGVSCGVIDEKGTDLYTARHGPVFLGCDFIQ